MDRRTVLKGGFVFAATAHAAAVAPELPALPPVEIPPVIAEAVSKWRDLMRQQKEIWDGAENTAPDDATHARWKLVRAEQLEAMTEMMKTLLLNS
jgi:hypothetical protein